MAVQKALKATFCLGAGTKVYLRNPDTACTVGVKISKATELGGCQ